MYLKKNGSREHLEFTFLHYLRRKWVLKNIDVYGERNFIDRNVIFEIKTKSGFLGSDLIIKEGVRIFANIRESVISIGDFTGIGANTTIKVFNRVTIGANCLIAPFCYISDDTTELKLCNINIDINKKGIEIGNDVWIGAGVRIAKPLKIGNGSVIAAGSLVETDVTENSIVGGNPARLIKYRK